MNTKTVWGPQSWVSYVLNGDVSSLDHYNTPSNAQGDKMRQDCDAWLDRVGGRAIDAKDAPELLIFGGLWTDCVEYTFVCE